MALGNPVGTYSPVEVSGWDVHESFFVETTTMESNGSGISKVYLRRSVGPNALIFVRLTDADVPDRSFPIAYRAEEIRLAPQWGLYEVALTPLRRRNDWARAEFDLTLAS